MKTIIRYGIAILACYASLYVGSLFFAADVADWYTQISTYAYALPYQTLIVVALVIYGITAIAIGMLWSSTTFWHAWVSCTFLSLLMGEAWIMFFFGYHAVFIGLCFVSLVFMMAVPLFLGAWEIERKAFYLFIPYFLWCTYALYFTAAVWIGMGR